MNQKEIIEERVRKVGGQYAEEIIESVKKLAEIDVSLKNSMDEIERLDDVLVRRHNEISDRINDLIRQSVDEKSICPGRLLNMDRDLDIRMQFAIPVIQYPWAKQLPLDSKGY